MESKHFQSFVSNRQPPILFEFICIRTTVDIHVLLLGHLFYEHNEGRQYVLSSSRRLTVLVVGYLFSIIQAIAIMTVNFFAVDLVVPLPPWAMWYPPVASSRGIQNSSRILPHLGIIVGAQYIAFQGLANPGQAHATMGACIAWAIGFSVVFFALAIYFDQVLERPNVC